MIGGQLLINCESVVQLSLRFCQLYAAGVRVRIHDKGAGEKAQSRLHDLAIPRTRDLGWKTLRVSED